MNPFTLALIGLVIAALWVLYRRQPAAQKGPYLVKLALISLVAGLIFLAVTRRFYLLGALLAGFLPFIRHLMPWLMRLLPLWMHWRIRKGGAAGKKGSTGNSGQRSEVKADILEMELDHDTGVMYGTVVEGPMAGRDLADLKDDEFIELLLYCREKDTNSARLLETYLDKRFGEKWRQDDPGQTRADENDDEAPLNETEALNLLGLTAEATRDDIIKAHRKLMLKHHPDRGGDPKMAARLNAARSFLLGD
ncbi:MAG: DnaJ domain-containing protein [Saccharospirillum sp.]|nr:DnaJ domain-containing protein [Saccharospirillum sp.]